MTSPAVALFEQIEEMVGRGSYGHAAEARAELRERFGYDVSWRSTPSGPVAEVVASQTQNAPGGESRGAPLVSLVASTTGLERTPKDGGRDPFREILHD